VVVDVLDELEQAAPRTVSTVSGTATKTVRALAERRDRPCPW